MHFSYVKDKGKKDPLKLNRKRSMLRPLACSFKRSCSIVKSQEELVAKQENAEENSVNGQQEQPVETNIQDDNTTESEIQSTGASECSSLTEEDKVVTEEKMTLQKSNDPQVSSTTLKEFQYKPALIPQTRKFPMGITFVDSQGYIYAQEVKEGE